MIETAARLFDPMALLLVGGGTLAATLVSSTGGDLKRALRALWPLLRADPHGDGIKAANAVRQIERISQYKGIVCADRVKTPLDFVHRAACRLAECEAGAFGEWAAEEAEARRVRHEGAAAVWRTAAEVAPAMGMIGTVTGLVAMFANMSDPASMGPAMATAMLTTLYGLLIAACIAGPIAARLERLSQAELRWQRQVLEKLEALALQEEPLRVFLHPRARARARA